MEGFDAQGGVTDLFLFPSKKGVGCQQQCGTDALATETQCIVDGLVEFFRLKNKLFFGENLRHAFEIVFYIIH